MLKSSLASALLVMVALGDFATQAEAVVTLQLRPTSQMVMAGQPVEVALYAVADPPQAIGVITAVLYWDPADLVMQDPENHGDGAYPWYQSYVDTSPSGLDPATGYAYYLASVSSCGETAIASPGGLKVTTFRFVAGANTGPTLVEVLSSYDVFYTWVYDELPQCGGQLVTVELDPAVTVTVLSCGSDEDCGGDSACTDDACVAGVCTHEPNFPASFFCCDPATGDLTLLNDGNDCTEDECDASGQPTHDNKD